MDVQVMVFASLLCSRSGRSHTDRERCVTPAQAAAKETRGRFEFPFVRTGWPDWSVHKRNAPF